MMDRINILQVPTSLECNGHPLVESTTQEGRRFLGYLGRGARASNLLRSGMKTPRHNRHRYRYRNRRIFLWHLALLPSLLLVRAAVC